MGNYPERSEDDAPEFERKIRHFFRKGQYVLSTRANELDTFAKMVNQFSEAFLELNEHEVNHTILELKYLLSRDGFIPPHCAKAFALIKEVSGRVIGLRHFDSQLRGGWVILQGRLAEMQTGEGKTLTATLAAATAALAGVPTHVITVNEYLSERDAEVMRPLYEALGLRVGFVGARMSPVEKKENYDKDITYCTNNQVAFDYLRDQMTMGQKKGKLGRSFDKYNQKFNKQPIMLRGLCFAIVDEADSVLIDEARTPLVIAKDHNNPIQQTVYKEALQVARKLHVNVDFKIDRSLGTSVLTKKGMKTVQTLTEHLSNLWSSANHRNTLMMQALNAIYLYLRDEQYLVKDDRVHIIDSNTGRLMSDRSWERGLHQMIECKENCLISGLKETLARLTYQRFFRRYLRLSGMSGTVREVEDELIYVYNLNVVTVKTHKPCLRTSLGDVTYKTMAQKNDAVLSRILEIHKTGRPVLVGTCSVGDSELLGDLLTDNQIPHQILNAQHDDIEASIIEKAGEYGAVTIATNMAGRGTDIKISEEVSKLGGLHVLATEKNELGRVDRQLYGRCARQGDPGSYECIASLDDSFFVHTFPLWTLKIVRAFGFKESPVNQKFALLLIKVAHHCTEYKYKKMRLNMIRQDKALSKLLAFTGKLE